MSKVYVDKIIDCTIDNHIEEIITGYEYGVKTFRFKPLNGHIPIDLSG